MARQMTYEFLMQGGRYLDHDSNDNACMVGKGVREALADGVPREEVYFSTKLAFDAMGYYSTLFHVATTLRMTGLGYLDLVLIPFPPKREMCGGINSRDCRKETWKALAHLKAMGLVKHLGVSNFAPFQIEELQALGLSAVEVNQLEYHPWLPAAHRDVVQWCHQERIVVVAYGSVSAMRMAQDKPGVLDRVSMIGAQQGKNWGQVLLRWAVQQNVSVIPHTGTALRISQNMELFDWTLSVEDMAYLNNLSHGESPPLFHETSWWAE